MRYSYITLIALLGCLAVPDSYARSMTENEAIQEYLENINRNGYNKNVLPDSSDGHGKPVQVRCTFYLIDIHKVDDASMDYKAQFYLRQSWNDSRLAFLDRDIDTVVLSDPKLIWTPDLFFRQEKEGILHNLIAPNVFIRIVPEGEVLYSIRLSVTFSCPMDFRKYPHDTQKCVFAIESYGFNRNQLQLSWDDRKSFQAVGYNKDMDMLTFELKRIREYTKNLEEKFDEYTVLEVELTLQRKIGFFAIKLYLPFSFLIIISWLSLWIPAKSVVPRLSLLIIIMYLMIHIGSEVNAYIPPAPYIKGSDVWIAVCESLVFASFLEFLAVHIISNYRERIQKTSCKKDPEIIIVLNSDEKKNEAGCNSSNSSANMIINRLKRDLLVSSRLDKISRILFPITFFIFNCVYWIVYASEQ